MVPLKGEVMTQTRPLSPESIPNWRAIFFDLDGTLVETAGEIADAVNDTLTAWHLPAVTQEQVEDWIGHGTKTLLIQALAYVKGVSVDEINESAFLSDVLPTFDHHYKARCGTRSQLYPHVREALAYLREAGVKLAVVTNKEGRYTDTVLKAQRLHEAFDAVVSGDTFDVKKPNPKAVSQLLLQWQIDPSAALFVGDSSIDAATARNAGIKVWLLPYGYNMGAPVNVCEPDRVIENFAPLMHGADFSK